MWRIFEFGCVFVHFSVVFSYFLFSTKSQVAHIIIGVGRITYHIQAISVVGRTNCIEISKFLFSVEKNRFEKSFFFRLISMK